MNGAPKPELQELPRIKERLSFIYLEYCKVGRKDSALSVERKDGTVCIPIASIATMLLGPGTSITHRAMELIGDVGASVVWVGENGSRYYAHGRPITHSSLLLETQAKLVSNVRTRLAVARMMYQMRFPGEDVSGLTMQQLRGREGSRVRQIYKALSNETGVEWGGREYDPNDYANGDDINRAISAANTCLYGIAHSVIAAMGCSPGLGFIHTGHDRSFVYDIADLYKMEVSVPTAFRTVAACPESIDSSVRRAMRDVLKSQDIMPRIVSDIHTLFSVDQEGCNIEDKLNLWDDKEGKVDCGVSYGICDE